MTIDAERFSYKGMAIIGGRRDAQLDDQVPTALFQDIVTSHGRPPDAAIGIFVEKALRAGPVENPDLSIVTTQDVLALHGGKPIDLRFRATIDTQCAPVEIKDILQRSSLQEGLIEVNFGYKQTDRFYHEFEMTVSDGTSTKIVAAKGLSGQSTTELSRDEATPEKEEPYEAPRIIHWLGYMVGHMRNASH